ncbi:MAG: hypothetical protein M0008_07970 [Actinomycetota bacterium]|jgi:hypothetical protein|nr:hypothetical protein [Actinomycetota bacterium]
MNENTPLVHRAYRRVAYVVAIAFGAAGLIIATASLSTANHTPIPSAVRLVASASGSSPTGADQAAVAYVDTHYPGTGAARVLKTEPDLEHGVAVYDVRVVAPNGVTYVVHVQRSNDLVLSVSPAEGQPTSTAPSPPSTSKAPTSPEPSVAPKPVETPEPSVAPKPVETPEPPASGNKSADNSPDRASTPATTAPSHSTDHPDQPKSGSPKDHSASPGKDG